jgi:broad specificity phosphatase PhoE
MRWHGRIYLIDHGASLIFQHNWPRDPAALEKSARRPVRLEDHVFARFEPDLKAADAELAPLVTAEALDAATALVPDEWLAGESGFDSPDEVRKGFAAWFAARLRGPRAEWLPELGR